MLCCTAWLQKCPLCYSSRVSLSASFQLYNFHHRAAFGGASNRATWAPLNSQQRVLFEFVPADITQQFSSSTRGAQGQNLITSAPRSQGSEDVNI